MELTGRCICGEARYRISEGPLVARSCWCRDCQSIAGGSSTVNAISKTNAISLEGELKEYVTVADSGNVMHWKFCHYWRLRSFMGTSLVAFLGVGHYAYKHVSRFGGARLPTAVESVSRRVQRKSAYSTVE